MLAKVIHAQMQMLIHDPLSKTSAARKIVKYHREYLLNIKTSIYHNLHCGSATVGILRIQLKTALSHDLFCQNSCSVICNHSSVNISVESHIGNQIRKITFL